MPEDQILLRDSTAADIPAIAAIYGHWVTHGRASFELVPPGETEMAKRRDANLAAGYPYIVATDAAGRLIGYAYACAYRARPAYRFSVENSIYVAPDAGRRGAGGRLLPALIQRCEAAGFRLMIAVIGDSANAPSIGLHAACGFTHCGVLPAVGWKHGQWVDTVLMTRPLGQGPAIAPA